MDDWNARVDAALRGVSADAPSTKSAKAEAGAAFGSAGGARVAGGRFAAKDADSDAAAAAANAADSANNAKAAAAAQGAAAMMSGSAAIAAVAAAASGAASSKRPTPEQMRVLAEEGKTLPALVPRVAELERTLEEHEEWVASARELLGPKKPPKPPEPGIPGNCLLYTSPSPRDQRGSRMPSSA